MLATQTFIREGRYRDTLKLTRLLRDDREDLIQKVVGWMLREVGKRDLRVEEDFLKRNYRHMGRTALRYAIERFPAKKRKLYLDGRA